MQPAVITAIEEWELAWNRSQAAATRAMKAAFTPLTDAKHPKYCCDIMLDYEDDSLGAGRLCIDDFGRATIEFDDVPNGLIAEAIDEVWGIGWFDGADGPLEACGPGTYNYDDETTSAEYEIVLGDQGVGKVFVSYVPVPDAAAVLDALTTAAARHD
ncbi:hypothetical protein [Streptomyces sp. NEAU-S7GS2]|uniref:hypothetical protein n=1 Tax=Streptomyces sp. NEAU-S7GS2 TaxID=2202000 RepID=UPI000D6F06BB|nr:hypothetical protein [Streptomyces sp. NEAU-S7GS2]AWN24785.1 hypothetical protein DKG71_00065 [Streptomyces sp. NEAU-S7GS2]